jgi:predicted TIM-barrel fold metal-dependent hydrolase
MVSSNFPVDKVGFGYQTVWNMFRRIADGSSSDERAVNFHGTARRLYRI